MSLERVCPFCETSVDPQHPRTWTRVVGWSRSAGVRESGKRGGSDIALRERRDEFAHDACIRLVQKGLFATQETLL